MSPCIIDSWALKFFGGHTYISFINSKVMQSLSRMLKSIPFSFKFPLSVTNGFYFEPFALERSSWSLIRSAIVTILSRTSSRAPALPSILDQEMSSEQYCWFYILSSWLPIFFPNLYKPIKYINYASWVAIYLLLLPQ